ncbi:MAG: hypothetical protein H8E91_05310 [Planctomycetes bacterium]|nr:hypothetical protein [Planctomycetota bacterium]
MLNKITIVSLAFIGLLTLPTTVVAAGDPCDQPLPFCPEDIDLNGEIGIDDVLQILLHWDECGDGTYRPVGDIDGDCCVGILDVLQIIDRWDSDCIPKGACCMQDGSGCFEEINEPDCLASDGTWHGEDSICAEVSCPVVGSCCLDDGSCSVLFDEECIQTFGAFQGQGSDCTTTVCPQPGGTGDDCADAFFAYFGENYFDTSLATTSFPLPDDSQCPGTYLNWGESQDVWFLFVAHASGWVHITTCDAASYDTSIVLYENSCENQVACNGDGTGDAGCQSYYSNIDYEVTAGSSYWIRIGGLGGQTGEGTLTIE